MVFNSISMLNLSTLLKASTLTWKCTLSIYHTMELTKTLNTSEITLLLLKVFSSPSMMPTMLKMMLLLLLTSSLILLNGLRIKLIQLSHKYHTENLCKLLTWTTDTLTKVLSPPHHVLKVFTGMFWPLSIQLSKSMLTNSMLNLLERRVLRRLVTGELSKQKPLITIHLLSDREEIQVYSLLLSFLLLPFLPSWL